MNTEFHTPFEWLYVYALGWKWTHDSKNPHFFVTTEPNRMGLSTKMQIISPHFYILIINDPFHND